MGLTSKSEPESTTTFLMVDHNPEDVSLVRGIFERAGDCKVHAVADCQHAFDYLTGQGIYWDRTQYPMPRLILLDLTGQSFEFLQWLREGAAQPLRAVPVTLLSSRAEPGDIELTRRLGVNSWLLKPGTRFPAAD
jgi:CheY-like chemotaxis protein